VDSQLESLTPREREVLQLMAEGLPSRGVALRLGISYTTVRTHIRSLGGKLGVHSKLEAIVKARELGLFSQPPPPCGALRAAPGLPGAVCTSGRLSPRRAEPRASAPSD